tara:strand:+ start:523 stop:771 length:249 start_codon:yes stop_codon:yes gene_type:complete
MICGGYSNEKIHDDESNEVFESIKNNIKYSYVKVISYKTQIVNGINYILKILLENEELLFVKVYKDLNNNFEVIEQNIKSDF